VAAKVAISEVAGVFAENWDDDEEEDEEDDDGPENRAYEVVGGDIESAAESFLEGAKALLVGQRPIPGLTWPAGLNESIVDAAVEAVRTVSPNYAGNVDTGWAQKVFQSFGIEQGESTDGTLEEACAELRELLEPEVDKILKTGIGSKILVILSGLPGTGKSHFAEELSRQVPCLVLGSDRLRKSLNSRPSYSGGESARLFTAIRRIIPEYLGRDVPIVFDATNLAESHRQPLCSIADHMEACVQIVGFTASPAVIRRRLEKRESTPDSNDYSDATRAVYRRLASTEEPIHQDHLLISSSKDVPDVIATVVSMMQAVSSGEANVTVAPVPTTRQAHQTKESPYPSASAGVEDALEEPIGSLYDFIDLLEFQNSELGTTSMFSSDGRPISLAGHAAVENGWGPDFEGALNEATGNRSAAEVLTEVFRLFPWELERLEKAERGETYKQFKVVRTRILNFCKNNGWTRGDRPMLESLKASEFDVELDKFIHSQNSGFDLLSPFLEVIWQDASPFNAVGLGSSTARLLAANPDNVGLLMLQGLSEAVRRNGNLTTAGEHLLSAMDLAAERHHLDEELLNSVCISVLIKVSAVASTGVGTSNGRFGNEVTKTVYEAFHRSNGMNRKLARDLLSRAGNSAMALIPTEWLVNQLARRTAEAIQRNEVK
jgi:predicted kinase